MMRCLEMAGFKMAEDLQPGDGGNIYGYYESKRFKDLCRKEHQRRIEKHRTFDRALEALKTSSSMLHKPDEDLRRLLGEKGKWAWKWPLAVFLLDEMFEAAENVVVIFMSRPKDDVINSLIRHCEIKGVTPYSEEIYAEWYDMAFKFFQVYKHKKILVNFLDLVENEKMVMNEILDFLGLEPNYDCSAVDIGEVHFK